MTLSIVINHCKARPDRVACLTEQRKVLAPHDGWFLVNDDPALKPAGPTKVEWEKLQWNWALGTQADHCLFMSDDTVLAPRFLDILHAMIAAKPDKVIGLLSNHPRAIELADRGERWYRCNSWLVGPGYVVPREHLRRFYGWFTELPPGDAPGQQAHLNDDSTLNEWITRHGPGESWHPLPTIIEAQDIETTWVSGDVHSRERVNWRKTRVPVGSPHRWVDTARAWDLDAMCDAEYWRREGPMMTVGES